MRRVALGSVAEVVAGQSPEGKFYNNARNGLPFYQGKKDFGEKFISPPSVWTSQTTKIAKPNDILMSVRAPVGPVNFATQKCCIGRGLAGIRGGEMLDQHFLFYQLLALQPEISGNEGAVFASINKAQIEALQVVVPPLAEQHRVVAFLDQAFAGIATAKANVEKSLRCAREVFESARQDLFSSVSEVCETSLGNEVELLVGFAFKSSGYVDTGDSVRLLRGDNIIQGSIRWDDAKRWSAADADGYARFALREGDVVLAMDRPWVKAGLKRALLQAEDVPALLVQRTACLRAGPRMDNRYMFQLISANDFSRHLLGVQTGIGVPHISGQQIKDFNFALPPLAEQRRILVQLDALQAETRHLESIYTRKLAALDELKQSLLQRAFSGQL